MQRTHVSPIQLAAILLAADTGGGSGGSTTAQINLANLDLIVLVDKSGSMGSNMPNGQTRTQYCAETIKPFVSELGKYDDDGIDMAFYNRSFTPETKVKPDTFAAAFDRNAPGGGTEMAAPLRWALDLAVSRFGEKNQLIIVLTDGMPDDKEASAKAIAETTQRMERDDQLAILFLQVGDDTGATQYLTYLDDELVSKLGAKFDIVDCKQIDSIAGKSLQEVVDTAFND